MKWINLGLLMMAMTIITACSLPTTKTDVGSERPTLAIIGAPAGTTLFVDGKAVGRADRFNGITEILYIEEGPHTVVVQQNGQTLYQEKIFVAGGETKRVEVSGAAPAPASPPNGATP